MNDMQIPSAAQLRPARRPQRGGRTYIGPKVQMNVPEEQYDFVRRYMIEMGWGEERWADALRAVFACGVAHMEVQLRNDRAALAAGRQSVAAGRAAAGLPAGEV